jgi:apolipoprotein N-acyltransferase
MMLYAACLARIVPLESRRWTWWPLAPLVATAGLTLLYGEFRMAEYRTQVRERALNEDQQPLRVALLQEVVDTRFEFNPERNLATFELYWEAALRAREENPELDVILWPEGVFTENQPELRRRIVPRTGGREPEPFRIHETRRRACRRFSAEGPEGGRRRQSAVERRPL